MQTGGLCRRTYSVAMALTTNHAARTLSFASLNVAQHLVELNLVHKRSLGCAAC
jgi:hypothetical protein